MLSALLPRRNVLPVLRQSRPRVNFASHRLKVSATMQRLTDASEKLKLAAANRLTDIDFGDFTHQSARNDDDEPEYLDDARCSRATQTVGKVPKVYLTQAWKYTKMPGVQEDRTKVDFTHLPRVGTMRNDLHRVCVPEGLNIDQLEQEPSFLRILHESNKIANKSMADHFDASTRLQMGTGEFHLNRTAQTDAAVLSLPFAKDELWFADDPRNVEDEMANNKALVKEFVKASGVFSSRDLYLMLQSRKARRQPIEGLILSNSPHPGLEHDHKEAEIHSIEQYKIASDRRQDYLFPSPSPEPPRKARKSSAEASGQRLNPVTTHLYDLPPNSFATEAVPELVDFKSPSVENLSEAINEIFHYAKRQKNLLNADSMVFYTVTRIDGPIVELEKYPPKVVSEKDDHDHVPGTAQTAAQVAPTKTDLKEDGTGSAGAADDLSELDNAEEPTNSEAVEPAFEVPEPVPVKESVEHEGTRSTLPEITENSNYEKSNPSVELTVDLSNSRDLLALVLSKQTWFRVVNLRAYLGHGCRFIPQPPDNAKSTIVIPVGLHDGRPLGFVTFIRCGVKPNFTDSEAEVTFSQIAFMKRHRYYAAVRHEQSKTEWSLMKEMHAILKLDDAAVDEFLQHTLTLSRILCDAEQFSCFLVNKLTESLSRDSELIPLHWEADAADSITDRKSHRSGPGIRMSVDEGVVGCAYRHRRTYAQDGTPDENLMSRDGAHESSSHTKGIVCVPFLMGDEPYGLVQLEGKRSTSQFAPQDISMLHLNSIFPALGILLAWYRFNSNKQEYLINITRAKTAYMRNRRLHRATRLWRPHEIPKLVPTLPVVTPDMAEASHFYVDHLAEMPEVAAALIKDMLTDLHLDETVLWNFVLHVRDCYFRWRFKDRKYAFAALQAVYGIIKKSGDLFTDDDKLSLAVAAVCHGVDHFGFNGALTEGTDVPRGLAHIYSITTPDTRTAHGLIVLLRERSTNVFHSYHTTKWRRLMEGTRKCVMATHIPPLLERVAALKSLVETPGFQPGEFENRQQIKELVTIAASLNSACRIPELYQEITKCAHEEYNALLDELSSRPHGNFCPRWTVPDDAAAVKDEQICFLRRICLPVFELLKTILPDTSKFYDGCVRNIEKLEGAPKRLDQVSAHSRVEHGGRRKDRRMPADMKQRLRRKLFDEMRLPVDDREVTWSALEDMPFLWHHKDSNA